MSLALRVSDGVVTKGRVDEGETSRYEALKRAVLGSEEAKKQTKCERQISPGLPTEPTEEEFREMKGKRVLGKLCFGV